MSEIRRLFLDYLKYLSDRKAIKKWAKDNVKVTDWKSARKVIDQDGPKGMYVAKESGMWLAVCCFDQGDVWDVPCYFKWEAIMWLRDMNE